MEMFIIKRNKKGVYNYKNGERGAMFECVGCLLSCRVIIAEERARIE